jgi:hypothetical protein
MCRSLRLTGAYMPAGWLNARTAPPPWRIDGRGHLSPADMTFGPDDQLLHRRREFNRHATFA